MAGKLLTIALRGLGFLFALITTALLGNVIASNVHAASSATMAINYSIFTSVWAWVTVIIGLASVFAAALSGSLVLIFFDVFAVLFTFVDAIVLSAKLRAVNCGNIGDRHFADSWIAFGSNDDEKRCREIQATTVFMWFLWAVLVPALAFTLIEARNGGLGFSSRRSTSGPSMSQV